MLEEIDELYQIIDDHLKLNKELVNDYLDLILDYNAIKNRKNKITKEITDKITEPNLKRDLLNRFNFSYKDIDGKILNIKDTLRKLTLFRTINEDFEKALYHGKKYVLLENKDELLRGIFYITKSGYTKNFMEGGLEKATEYIENEKKKILANPHMPKEDQKKRMEMYQDIIKGTTPVWL
ncbi:MAG: hypothetical protein KAU20_08035 [Nanoarchaeota archaeon]|nr:hypothetical protein [Nanoarchaeota archaeon]